MPLSKVKQAEYMREHRKKLKTVIPKLPAYLQPDNEGVIPFTGRVIPNYIDINEDVVAQVKRLNGRLPNSPDGRYH